MSTTPMPGFHYVDFAESDDAAVGVASVENDDCERIAQQFLYCSMAVREWPKFRRDAIRRKRLTPETCDQIERNVIAIFQEFVDVLTAAMEAGDLRPISEPALRVRLAHAHAYLALRAAPENLAAYWKDFPALFDVDGNETDVDGFMKAVWEAAWNRPAEKTPAAVTFQGARNHKQQQLYDGVADSRGHFEVVLQLKANARIEDPERLDEAKAKPFSERQEAWIRRGLRQIGRLNGLKKHQVDFLVQLALNQKDPGADRSAIRAIRDRKIERLLPEIKQLIAESRHHR
jgi:hypothetical protein